MGSTIGPWLTVSLVDCWPGVWFVVGLASLGELLGVEGDLDFSPVADLCRFPAPAQIGPLVGPLFNFGFRRGAIDLYGGDVLTGKPDAISSLPVAQNDMSGSEYRNHHCCTTWAAIVALLRYRRCRSGAIVVKEAEAMSQEDDGMGHNARRPIIIGVAGGTGSGKTTVSQAILDRVGRDRIAYIQHDSYYKDRSHLPPEARVKINFDHPDALETEFLVQHLKELKDGHPVEVPVYDFTTHTRASQTQRVEPCRVILVEGILIFADDALRDMMDVKIYVDTDADIRFIRRLERDIAERGRTMNSVIDQYLTTVRPMHLEFAEPSKRYADVIIPEGGFNPVALDMVVARIEAMIEETPNLH